MSSVPDASVVASSFVKQYYGYLEQNPDQLFKFYKAQSTFSFSSDNHGGAPVSAVGQEEIHEKIMAALLHHCKAEILGIDSQESRQGGVLVLVTGYLLISGVAVTQFTQSFFLDRQTQPYDGYFVLNDILRYFPPIITAPTVPRPMVLPDGYLQVPPLVPQPQGPQPQQGQQQALQQALLQQQPQPQGQPQTPAPLHPAAAQQHQLQEQQQQQQQQQQQPQARQWSTFASSAPQVPHTAAPSQAPSVALQEKKQAETREREERVAAEEARRQEEVAEKTDLEDTIDDEMDRHTAEVSLAYEEEEEEEEEEKPVDEEVCVDDVVEPQEAAHFVQPQQVGSDHWAAEECTEQPEKPDANDHVPDYLLEEAAPRNWASIAGRLQQEGGGQLGASRVQGFACPATTPSHGYQQSSGSSSHGVWLWVSRLPTDPPAENQEVIDAFNEHLVGWGSDGRATEVQRRDMQQEWASALVTNQEAADTLLALSKERGLLLRGKPLKAEVYRTPYGGQRRSGRGGGEGRGGRGDGSYRGGAAAGGGRDDERPRRKPRGPGDGRERYGGGAGPPGQGSPGEGGPRGYGGRPHNK